MIKDLVALITLVAFILVMGTWLDYLFNIPH